MVLEEVSEINSTSIVKREKERYEKGVSTGGVELAQSADLIVEDRRLSAFSWLSCMFVII